MPVFIVQRLFKLLKKHWKPILCLVVVIGCAFLYVTNEDGWTKRWKELRKIHDDQIQVIERARQTERDEHAKIEAELRQKLDMIQRAYEKGQADLAAARRKEVNRIVDAHRGDPRGLADELSSVTGWKVVKP